MSRDDDRRLDPVRVERALAGDRQARDEMSPAEKVDAVRQCLDRLHPMTVTAIAERLHMNNRTVQKIIDTLGATARG